MALRRTTMLISINGVVYQANTYADAANILKQLRAK
jgi:hypothetical protein